KLSKRPVNVPKTVRLTNGLTCLERETRPRRTAGPGPARVLVRPGEAWSHPRGTLGRCLKGSEINIQCFKYCIVLQKDKSGAKKDAASFLSQSRLTGGALTFNDNRMVFRDLFHLFGDGDQEDPVFHPRLHVLPAEGVADIKAAGAAAGPAFLADIPGSRGILRLFGGGD